MGHFSAGLPAAGLAAARLQSSPRSKWAEYDAPMKADGKFLPSLEATEGGRSIGGAKTTGKLRTGEMLTRSHTSGSLTTLKDTKDSSSQRKLLLLKGVQQLQERQ